MAWPRTTHKAKALFTKACDGDVMMGCNGLGAIYDSGRGVNQDYAQALSWWKKACDGGMMKSLRKCGQRCTCRARALRKTSRRP